MFILSVVSAVVLLVVGSMFYHGYREHSKTRRLAEEALKGPELTLQQLAQYQGWFATTITKIFFGEDYIVGVLRLTKPIPSLGQKEIYVHVSEVAWYQTWFMVDVISIHERIKKNQEAKEQEEKDERDRQELLERIRKGETSEESSSSSS
ncbi:MAG: hypothetical protein G01um101419_510 [Parcubacteria group bacterium Gr01-1014_19]|nr:MAG: hypothetical protein G01um101419_510 [Parcubacteria group bacterium Gr01-1014_19]